MRNHILKGRGCVRAVHLSPRAHFVRSIGSRALDPQHWISDWHQITPAVGTWTCSPFPTPHSLFLIPYMPWGWDQMSLNCQEMVPAALKLCPARGKILWQHGKGLCL